jgi:DNA replication protein DnaC
MSFQIPADLACGLLKTGYTFMNHGRRYNPDEFRTYLYERVAANAMTPERATRIFKAAIHAIKVDRAISLRMLLFPDGMQFSIDYSLLPNPAAFDLVKTWTPKLHRNLVVFGDTGTGKTRAVYELFRALVRANPDADIWTDRVRSRVDGEEEPDWEGDDHGIGWSPLIDIPATVFAAFARTLSLRDPARLGRFTDHLKRAAILFIDDITQIRLTDRLAETLYDLVDARYRNNRPLIVTSQVGADDLVDKLAHGDKSFRITARAIVRRISEDGRAMAVDFDAPTQSPTP